MGFHLGDFTSDNYHIFWLSFLLRTLKDSTGIIEFRHKEKNLNIAKEDIKDARKYWFNNNGINLFEEDCEMLGIDHNRMIKIINEWKRQDWNYMLYLEIKALFNDCIFKIRYPDRVKRRHNNYKLINQIFIEKTEINNE